MKVRLATTARPDDRHEFTAMNFDGDSAERMRASRPIRNTCAHPLHE